MNIINQELHDYRKAIEHYQRILKEDTLITKGEIPDDGRPKLTENDIKKINEKITVLTEQRDELLLKEKDYSEVV